MKRILITAAIFAALFTVQSFGQPRAGRAWEDDGRPGRVQRADSPRRGLNPDRSERPRQQVRQQLRDPANCPQDVRPGCGDPRDDRQHQWCARPAGSPGPGWRDRSGGGRGGRGSCGPRWDRGSGRFWSPSR